MADFVLYGDSDDLYTDPDGEFWYPGTGISTYNGGVGDDTLDFSAATDGFLWFEPGLGWVQDTSIPLGYSEELGQDIYAWATIQSFETILAGSGNDTMYGNGVEGLMLDAGAGNDIFLYGASTYATGQHYEGNLGDDILDFSAYDIAGDGWIYDLSRGIIINPRGWEGVITGIENVYSGAGDDTLVPATDTKVLSGGDGDDTFAVSRGIFWFGQTYIGGEGIDRMDLSLSAGPFLVDLSLGVVLADIPQFESYLFEIEVVLAGSGNDTLRGTSGDETMDGGAGADEIDGGNGNNRLLGRAGNDTITGGDGQDTMFGHSGSDELIGNAGHDSLSGQGGRDLLQGGLGEDTLKGGGGRDTLEGGDGEDLLKGNGGRDSLDGGGSYDTLHGGGGNDTLTGGSLADVFVFTNGHGVDVITDFNVLSSLEKIDLSGVSSINSMADLNDAAADGVNGVIIATGGVNSILLEGVSEADLVESDFIF